LTNLTANSKNYGQITLNTKPHLDPQYWHDLERKLLLYYFEHFIDFAAAEML